LKENYVISVKWIAFPLHPEIPEEGLTLDQLFAGRGIDVTKVAERLERMADDLRLPMGRRDRSYNSRLAQELGKWAETKNMGDAFHMVLFRAYFVDGRNIGKVEELVGLAQSVGLPEAEARGVLGERTFREAVDDDWKRCRALGITAVPTFMTHSRTVVGLQPYEVLSGLLEAAHVPRRV
jgi:predicted DsbA family dithiol-disulfide isomerase